jgi:hypothetical protein
MLMKLPRSGLFRALGPCLLLGSSLFPAAAHATSAPATCETLQSDLYTLSSGGGGTYQFVANHNLQCATRAEIYHDSISRHALLVPENVILDLNGGTLGLNLTGSDTYGVRLANGATIRNGKVQVLASSGSGSQAIFHSAISVGAAYGDGGPSDKPSYFSNIGNWSIRNVQVKQAFSHSAIHMMSEAHHGVIEDVRIIASDEALIGIGMDWGTVGEFHAGEDTLAAMSQLRAHVPMYAYTTHPHDILVQRIAVEPLTLKPGEAGGPEDNDDRAAIRTSAVHNVTIRDVIIDDALSGIVLRAGDVGYMFAKDAQRPLAHTGLVVENFTIHRVRRKGVIVDGYADNIDRANHLAGCAQLLNPLYSRLQSPQIRFGFIRGHFTADAGVFMQYTNGALVEDVDSEEFGHGIRIATAVTNSTVWRSDFLHNVSWGVYIYGEGDLPDNIAVLDNNIYLNGAGPIRNYNGINIQTTGNVLTPP